MIGDVQHDPDAIDDLIPTSRVGQAEAIAVLTWEAEFPCTQFVV